MGARKLLGQVTLRNTYRIHDCGNEYTCESTSKTDDSYIHTIPAAVVEQAASVLVGREWAVKDAELALKVAATRDCWKYEQGHKYQYFVQDILMVLVASGRASVTKEGRRFVYTVLR